MPTTIHSLLWEITIHRSKEGKEHEWWWKQLIKSFILGCVFRNEIDCSYTASTVVAEQWMTLLVTVRPSDRSTLTITTSTWYGTCWYRKYQPTNNPLSQCGNGKRWRTIWNAILKLFDSTISCKIPTNSPHQNPLIERDHLTGKMIQRGVSVGTNERSVLDISSSRSDSSQR